MTIYTPDTYFMYSYTFVFCSNSRPPPNRFCIILGSFVLFINIGTYMNSNFHLIYYFKASYTWPTCSTPFEPKSE